jgi:hypothetical protein
MRISFASLLEKYAYSDVTSNRYACWDAIKEIAERRRRVGLE